MDILSFSEKLRKILKEGSLPGHAAQLKMASDYYRNKRVDLEKLSGQKESAVCILFFEKNKDICFLLIRRPDTHKHHAGQIAFPGGKCEIGETFEQTALRELKEETGIQINPENILGKLTPMYIPVSNFYVQPVIASTESTFTFIKSTETEQYFEFPLKSLLDESILGETEVTTAGNIKLKTPYFDVQGFVLWGATAMVLSELKQLILQDRATFASLFL
jgi:mutator protein MutT